MGRAKKVFSGTIQLSVTGPRNLFSGPRKVDALLNQTWTNFFKEALRIKFEKNSGFFVCNMKYCPSSPRKGEGWRCELSDKVGKFVKKFARKRKLYAVRLCDDRKRVSETLNTSSGMADAVPNGSTGKTPSSRRSLDRATTKSLTGTSRTSLNGGTKTRSIGTITNKIARTNRSEPALTIRNRQPMTSPKGLDWTGINKPDSTDNQGSKTIKPIQGKPAIVLSTQGQLPPSMPLVNEVAQDPSSKNLADGVFLVPQVPKRKRKITIEQRRLPESSHEPLPAIAGPSRGPLGGASSSSSFLRKRLRSERIQSDIKTEEESIACDVPVIIRTVGNATIKVEPPPSVLELEPEWARNWDEPEGNARDSGNDIDGSNEVNINNPIIPFRDEDNDSTITRASVELEELRREGIIIEDVHTSASRRFSTFSNVFLLRLREEIQKLIDSGAWTRNATRAPLTAYLLQEIFKIRI